MQEFESRSKVRLLRVPKRGEIVQLARVGAKTLADAAAKREAARELVKFPMAPLLSIQVFAAYDLRAAH